jgi:hypothetical protein
MAKAAEGSRTPQPSGHALPQRARIEHQGPSLSRAAIFAQIWDVFGRQQQGVFKLLHIGGHGFQPAARPSWPIGGIPPIVKIQPPRILPPMKLKINNCMALMCVTTSAMALSFLLIGCDREVSSTKTSSENSDGSVKTKEKTTTQSSDGTVTKTEETKKTTPPEKP